MYQTTAKAIVATAQRIMNTEKRPCGVINPAQLFKGIEMETLKSLDCSVSMNEKITVQKC
jgi:hypothetical protein